MKGMKLFLYAILPYGVLGFIWIQGFNMFTLSSVFDQSALQRLQIISLSYMGGMLYVITHLCIDAVWKIRIGIFHTVVFLSLGVMSYYGFMNMEDFFELNQFKNRCFYILGTQTYMVIPTAMFFVFQIVHTIYMIKKSATSQSSHLKTTNLSQDTWLD